jgi:cysteine-rich repeat protein
MKFILSTFLVLFFSFPAFAANLTCTIPEAAVPRAVELCEILQARLKIKDANWNNSVCATEFLRIGLREGEEYASRVSAREAVKTAVTDALGTFDTNHPVSATVAVCGDSVVDTEFGETCDDGNTTSGDGCDAACRAE